MFEWLGKEMCGGTRYGKIYLCPTMRMIFGKLRKKAVKCCCLGLLSMKRGLWCLLTEIVEIPCSWGSLPYLTRAML